MLTDRFTTFALSGSAIVNDGSTAKIGSEIDILAPERDIANGTPLFFYLQVRTPFVGSGASFTLNIVSSATTNLAAPRVHWTSGVLTLADHGGAGRSWQPVLDLGDYLRYVGLTITGAGANITDGSIDGFMSLHRMKWAPFREGIS